MSEPILSTTAEPSAKGKPYRRYAFLVVGLAVYFFVVWMVGWQRIRDTLLSVDLRWLAGMFLLETMGLWVRALKWRYALGPGHRAASLFFVAKGAGWWSPGRLGEFVPLLMKRHRTPKVAAWILFDRIVELNVTLLLGLYGVVALGAITHRSGLGLAALWTALGFATLYAASHLRGVNLKPTRKGKPTLRARLLRLGGLLVDEIHLLGYKVPAVIAISIVVTCTDMLAAMCLFRSFGNTISFAAIATARCAHAVVAAVPLAPDASGIPYVTQAAILQRFAGVPTAVLATAFPLEIALLSLIFWSSLGLGALGFMKSQNGEA